MKEYDAYNIQTSEIIESIVVEISGSFIVSFEIEITLNTFIIFYDGDDWWFQF